MKCICGAEMEIFESNFGGHEGEFCLVCPRRGNKNEAHLTTEGWILDKTVLERVLEQKGNENGKEKDS